MQATYYICVCVHVITTKCSKMQVKYVYVCTLSCALFPS